MKTSKLIFYSLINSLGVLVYTSAVAWLMFNGQKFFGEEKNFLMPTTLLLLLVLSVSIVGLLIFGRPIYLYLNNSKPAAIKLLFYTIAWLALITIIVLAAQTLTK